MKTILLWSVLCIAGVSHSHAQHAYDSVEVVFTDIVVSDTYTRYQPGQGTTVTDTIIPMDKYLMRPVYQDSISFDTLIVMTWWGERTQYKMLFDPDTTLAMTFIYTSQFGSEGTEYFKFLNARAINTPEYLKITVDSAGLASGGFKYNFYSTGSAGSGGATYKSEKKAAGSFLATSRIDVTFHKHIPASVKELGSLLLGLYPNPVHNGLTVRTERASRVTIYDMLGRQLFAAEVDGEAQLNTSHFEAGVYMLRVGDEVHKFIVEAR